MRKKIYLLCMITLIGTSFMGCQKQPSSTKGSQVEQNMGDGTEKTQDSQMQSESEEIKEPELVEGEPYTIYVTKKNIYPMSEGKTVDGIMQQVLKCEVTRNFGNHKLANLAEYVREREIVEDNVDLNDIWNPNVLYKIDGKGNLTGSGCYVFCTIQFTNTTDKEVEILRNNGKIYFLNENLLVQEEGGYEVIYMDELWKGESSEALSDEAYHYKLGPGESVTSEVGWVVPNIGFEKYERMFYVMKMDDCMNPSGPGTDPDAILIELDYE